MTDHAQAMLDRMLSQFDGKENLTKLVTIMGNRFNVLEQVFADLRDSRWIETAEGTQLDGCGEIVAQDRLISYAIALPFFGFESQSSGRGFGKARMRHSGETYLSSAKLGDAEYRKMLKAKVFKNTSTGTAEEVITSIANIFGAAKIVITEIGGAKIRIGVGRDLTEAEITFNEAVNLMVKSGGIGIYLKSHFDPENVFGFKSQGYSGFGVGKFANTF